MKKSSSIALSCTLMFLSYEAFAAEVLYRKANEYKSISSPMKVEKTTSSPTGYRAFSTKNSSGSVTYNLELDADSEFQIQGYILAKSSTQNAIGISVNGSAVEKIELDINSSYKWRKSPKVFSGKKGLIVIKLSGVDAYTRIAAIQIVKTESPVVVVPPPIVVEPPPVEPTEPETGTPPISPTDIIVKNASELTVALDRAAAGDVIRIKNGIYSGKFKILRSGTISQPIHIIGEGEAILDAGSMTSGYGLEINGSHLMISGLHVRNAKKGIVLDGVQNSLMENMKVYNTGEEGIHYRTHSSNNILRNSEIFDIGLKNASYGEGVYIGSAQSNWCTYTDCEIDKSNNNLILNNKIYRTTAEPMDIKEGTTGNIVQGNTMDGSKIQGVNSADSFMDIKGNEVQILGNTFMMMAPNSKVVAGLQTHARVAGWGNNTVFKDNSITVEASGYGIEIDPKTSGSTVSCSNVSVGPKLGLSNIACK